MPISTLLAPGVSAEHSTTISVLSGQLATVGVYAQEDAQLPRDAVFKVECLTPGEPNVLAALDNSERQVCLAGPLTIRVSRPAYAGPAFGVFAYTA